jgi:hypothetical protein
MDCAGQKSTPQRPCCGSDPCVTPSHDLGPAFLVDGALFDDSFVQHVC